MIPDGEDTSSRNAEADSVDYKPKYRYLKRKLKCLLYEQECFQEELRRLQRKLLRVNRDKSFLLDRLLQYEPPEFSSSDEEETESSADEQDQLKSYWNSQAVPPPQENKPIKKATSSVQGTSQTASAAVSSQGQGGKSQQKPIKKKENVERARCKQRVENGKCCSKMVSKKIKSGLCLMHREEGNQQGQSSNKPAQQARIQAPTMANMDSSFFDEPNPMISGISNEHAQQAASATIPPDMYGISEDLKTTGAADSPASTDFPGNIYEGDDDLVIDLPE